MVWRLSAQSNGIAMYDNTQSKGIVVYGNIIDHIRILQTIDWQRTIFKKVHVIK